MHYDANCILQYVLAHQSKVQGWNYFGVQPFEMYQEAGGIPKPRTEEKGNDFTSQFLDATGGRFCHCGPSQAP